MNEFDVFSFLFSLAGFIFFFLIAYSIVRAARNAKEGKSQRNVPEGNASLPADGFGQKGSQLQVEKKELVADSKENKRGVIEDFKKAFGFISVLRFIFGIPLLGFLSFAVGMYIFDSAAIGLVCAIIVVAVSVYFARRRIKNFFKKQ